MFHNVANRRDGCKIGTVVEVKKEIPVKIPCVRNRLDAREWQPFLALRKTDAFLRLGGECNRRMETPPKRSLDAAPGSVGRCIS